MRELLLQNGRSYRPYADPALLQARAIYYKLGREAMQVMQDNPRCSPASRWRTAGGHCVDGEAAKVLDATLKPDVVAVIVVAVGGVIARLAAAAY